MQAGGGGGGSGALHLTDLHAQLMYSVQQDRDLVPFAA